MVCFYDSNDAVRDEFMQKYGFSIEGTAQDGEGEAFCYGKGGVNGILMMKSINMTVYLHARHSCTSHLIGFPS